MTKYPHIIKLLFGLFLFATGTVLLIQANIGLGAWEAFHAGIALKTGISFGTVMILSGLIILLIDILLHENIGIATLIDICFVGSIVDLIQSTKMIALSHHFFQSLIYIFGGQFLISVGLVFYIGQALGCGPRDALMVGIGKRINKVPIGFIRSLIEFSVLVIGYSLGAKIGIGTIIATVSIGIIMENTFKLFHFEIKEIEHQSLINFIKELQK